MDGENKLYNGKAYEEMGDLGIPLFLEAPIYLAFCLIIGSFTGCTLFASPESYR